MVGLRAYLAGLLLEAKDALGTLVKRRTTVLESSPLRARSTLFIIERGWLGSWSRLHHSIVELAQIFKLSLLAVTLVAKARLVEHLAVVLALLAAGVRVAPIR